MPARPKPALVASPSCPSSCCAVSPRLKLLPTLLRCFCLRRVPALAHSIVMSFSSCAASFHSVPLLLLLLLLLSTQAPLRMVQPSGGHIASPCCLLAPLCPSAARHAPSKPWQCLCTIPNFPAPAAVSSIPGSASYNTIPPQAISGSLTARSPAGYIQEQRVIDAYQKVRCMLMRCYHLHTTAAIQSAHNRFNAPS
jgi:hypothetical protein